MTWEWRGWAAPRSGLPTRTQRRDVFTCTAALGLPWHVGYLAAHLLRATAHAAAGDITKMRPAADAMRPLQAGRCKKARPESAAAGRAGCGGGVQQRDTPRKACRRELSSGTWLDARACPLSTEPGTSTMRSTVATMPPRHCAMMCAKACSGVVTPAAHMAAVIAGFRWPPACVLCLSGGAAAGDHEAISHWQSTALCEAAVPTAPHHAAILTHPLTHNCCYFRGSGAWQYPMPEPARSCLCLRGAATCGMPASPMHHSGCTELLGGQGGAAGRGLEEGGALRQPVCGGRDAGAGRT